MHFLVFGCKKEIGCIGRNKHNTHTYVNMIHIYIYTHTSISIYIYMHWKLTDKLHLCDHWNLKNKQSYAHTLSSCLDAPVSLHRFRHVAARAAARSTMRQQLTEQHGLPIFAREAVVQAQVAARATGHPLGSRDMAELVGKMPGLTRFCWRIPFGSWT